MTQKELKKEIQKIYNEMSAWPKINKRLKYKIPKTEIRRRESILSLQQILYGIEDAKKDRDKNKEYFNLGLYYITKSIET